MRSGCCWDCLKWCSASLMFAQAHTDGFQAIMRKKIASMLSRLRGSSNVILSVIANRTAAVPSGDASANDTKNTPRGKTDVPSGDASANDTKNTPRGKTESQNIEANSNEKKIQKTKDKSNKKENVDNVKGEKKVKLDQMEKKEKGRKVVVKEEPKSAESVVVKAKTQKEQTQLKIKTPILKQATWVPPFLLPRAPHPRRPHIPPEEMTKLYEGNKLKRIWHNFTLVDKNKMMLQGNVACNAKRFSTYCGAQTACIAVACLALNEEKSASLLVSRDVDDTVTSGDKYYRQCMLALKCYKGKPQLGLRQLLPTFYFHDVKYTFKMSETVRVPLAKRPDDVYAVTDLTDFLGKRQSSKFSTILSLGDHHFLVWSPDDRPVCYMFDPHMLNEIGKPFKVSSCERAGSGAFVRYSCLASLVRDLAANYGGLEPGLPVLVVALTDIEVEQRELLTRRPPYTLDLKALPTHCESEWVTLHRNILIEKKLREPKPVPPVSPELAVVRAPATSDGAPITGEGCFLQVVRPDCHAYGRDDMLPLVKSETMLHSVVEIANKHFKSQYQKLDAEKWILRGTRHMASKRYYKFKWYTAIACCVVALAMLRRLRARAWNEDIIDDTLDIGWNFYRESLAERKGSVRRLVLGELKDSFLIRDKEYVHKETNIAVWGRMVSTDPKVFDLRRGVEDFFRINDSGILQIPGEYETAIWNDGGVYYLYHPWPADRFGHRVSLQGGGKACLLAFAHIPTLCDYFLASARLFRRKPFSISAVSAWERPRLPARLNHLIPVGPERWVLRGSFHQGDERFPAEHRNKQDAAMAINTLVTAHIQPTVEWNKEDIDDNISGGEDLYDMTMAYLERMGISLDKPEPGGEEEEIPEPADTYTGMLAAGEVVDRFNMNDQYAVITEVLDGFYNGSLSPTRGVKSLKESLRELFKTDTHAVLTARGRSLAVWNEDNNFYLFDPQGCDENGFPSDDPMAAACLIRLGGSLDNLVKAIESNLPADADDMFSLSPVTVFMSKFLPDYGVTGYSEARLESKAFEWIKRYKSAIMAGPRGETTAAGRSAQRAGIGDDDKAGRTLALPAIAAFAAAADAVPPPFMHQDHMYNFIDAAADFYLEHLKTTGKKEITVEDLNRKFEMGVNTFTIELTEAYKRLPLRVLSQFGEEAAPVEEKPGEDGIIHHKDILELLLQLWNDHLNDIKPTMTALLVGDYHQLGIWMSAADQIVVFDPAPLLRRGALTEHRLRKGDELRRKRIAEERAGAEDAEVGADEAEGEEEPEPAPTPVPRDAAPALMVFVGPGEFIDGLVDQGPMKPDQVSAPYKLYFVKVTNELTAVYKDKRAVKGARPEGEENVDEQAADEVLVEQLDDSAVSKHMQRVSRAVASVRGRVAQWEHYFLEPQRDHQDAAIAVMAIIVENIEPYIHWRPELIDSIVKYGDRLYTVSLHSAKNKPRVAASECVKKIHVSSFNVKLATETDVVTGDTRASDKGELLNLERGIAEFVEKHKYGVLCSKDYCVAIWRGSEENCFCMFDPHHVGPNGRMSPIGGAGLVLFSCIEELAAAFKDNVDVLERPGTARYYITAVKVEWEYSSQHKVLPAGQGPAVPDEGYEFKVLTAYSEIGRGRAILRGSRPSDLTKFKCDTQMQSSAAAIVAACMTNVRQPHLWTKRTVDQVMDASSQLFTQSINNLGYEFRPDEDLLLPLQVLKRFLLGTNYVRYDLEEFFTGHLAHNKPGDVSFVLALERLFDRTTHGILWAAPHAVAVWRVRSKPQYHMFEPHACTPSGLRINAEGNVAACVLTFQSPQLLAYSFLQNYPHSQRRRTIFHLYSISVELACARRAAGDAGAARGALPATSKVGLDGLPRKADERDRRHPPGDRLCPDAMRAIEAAEKDVDKLKGRRNPNGWLVLRDGSQFLSAQHSMACLEFVKSSRGNQALACSVMAVAVSRVQDVCRWCPSTLDAVLLSGDQLYKDSYLHYRPKSRLLTMEQILRKFYAPGNCVCRVVVYAPRQRGFVHQNLLVKLTEFFREEKCGVFEAGNGSFAVALFRTPRGFYMFDPADRDRYGRAVPPPCVGHARACFSQYPTVQALADKLAPNIPFVYNNDAPNKEQSHTSTFRSKEPLINTKTSENKLEEDKSEKRGTKRKRETSPVTDSDEKSKITPKESRDNLIAIKQSESPQSKPSPSPASPVLHVAAHTGAAPQHGGGAAPAPAHGGDTSPQHAKSESPQSKPSPSPASPASHGAAHAAPAPALQQGGDTSPQHAKSESPQSKPSPASPASHGAAHTAPAPARWQRGDTSPQHAIHFQDIEFRIYGMEVTSLRRLNQHEK